MREFFSFKPFSYRNAIKILVVFSILVFVPFLIQGKSIITHDMAIIGLPALSFIHQMGIEGKMFFWNPYQYSGVPSIVSSMGTLFYPLNAFFLIFQPLDTLLHYFILHQVLAGICSFIFLKRLRFSPVACLTGAVLYAFSGARLMFLHTYEYYGILTFAPLALLAVDYLAEKYTLKAVILCSLVSGFIILGGGLHFLVIFFPVFVLYGLFRAWTYKKLFTWKSIAVIVGVTILTFGFSAPSLLPLSGEYMSMEPSRTVPFTFGNVTLGSVEPSALLTVPFSHFYGDLETTRNARNSAFSVEHSYFLETGGLLLTVMAFLIHKKRRRPLLIFFSIIFLLALLLALGRNNPLYYWLYQHFELFRQLRVPARFLVILPLFILYVAAVGMESFRIVIRKYTLCPDSIKKNLASVRDVFVVFTPVFYVLLLLVGNRAPGNQTFFLLSALPAVAITVFLAQAQKKRNMLRLVPYLLGWVILVTALSPLLFVQRAYFAKPDDIRRQVREVTEIKKLLSGSGAKILYLPNAGIPQVAGVCNVGGHFSSALMPYNEYFYTAVHKTLMTPDAAEYLIFVVSDSTYNLLYNRDRGRSRQLYPGDVNWEAYYKKYLAGNTMYRMLNPEVTSLYGYGIMERLPHQRFWFTTGYRVIPDKDEMLETMAKPDFNPEDKVLLLEEPPERFVPDTYIYSYQTPEITHFEPDEIRIDVSCIEGWLTFSDTYYPGWTARIDGREVPVLRGNFIFRTIPIPPMAQELVLHYEAPALKRGLLVFFITLSISIIYLVWLKIRQKYEVSEESSENIT